jgi:uncharacterized protein (DUF1697 family)
MADLRRAFEGAGFADVTTVLSSGNVVFSTDRRPDAVLARVAEAAIAKHLARAFSAIVRSSSALDRLIEADPYAPFRLPPNVKRVVTFLRDVPKTSPPLPLESEGVRMLRMIGREVFTAYARA